jgi:hypothetical protein
MPRVARHAGTVASCTWDYAGQMQMLNTFWHAALALDPAAPDEASALAYTDPDSLRELWQRSAIRNRPLMGGPREDLEAADAHPGTSTKSAASCCPAAMNSRAGHERIEHVPPGLAEDVARARSVAERWAGRGIGRSAGRAPASGRRAGPCPVTRTTRMFRV